MQLRNLLFAGLLFGVMAGVSACGSDDTQKAGNDQNCGAGETCTNNCDDGSNTCNMNCSKDSHCKATCQEGQSCTFNCSDTATCEFDCTKGDCTVQGSSENCTCTGNCTGICGGTPGGTNGGSTNCDCGDPTDPGYAQCMQDCAD